MKTVAQLLGHKVVDGDIGIEIEVEGEGLPVKVDKWCITADGSLRGESAEYVLPAPIKVEDVDGTLACLEEAFQKYKSKIFQSVRTGVHVHINVQRLTRAELFNYITCFLILEEMLVNYCGEERQNNLFCLRASDATYLIDSLVEAAASRNLHILGTDTLRYSAINVKAIATYGSLEFRCMRGERDLGVISRWAKLLYNLREFSCSFENPQKVVEALSMMGPEAFYKAALGEYAEEVWDNAVGSDSLYRGVRLAQDIAYSSDWDEPNIKVIGGIDFPDNGEWFNEPLGDV